MTKESKDHPYGKERSTVEGAYKDRTNQPNISWYDLRSAQTKKSPLIGNFPYSNSDYPVNNNGIAFTT